MTCDRCSIFEGTLHLANNSLQFICTKTDVVIGNLGSTFAATQHTVLHQLQIVEQRNSFAERHFINNSVQVNYKCTAVISDHAIE